MWILLYCVSVSHKTAPAEIREKFNYSKEEKIELLRQMRSIFSVKEALVLCTCNRTEFYFCGDKNSVLEMEKLVSRVSHVSLDDIKEFFRIYGDKKSIDHIFRVTCGIESMIIGEDEILGQVNKGEVYSVVKVEDIGNNTFWYNVPIKRIPHWTYRHK